MQVCLCSDCSQLEYTDEIDSLNKPGKRFKPTAYKSHQAVLQAAREIPVLRIEQVLQSRQHETAPAARLVQPVPKRQMAHVSEADKDGVALRDTWKLDPAPVIAAFLTIGTWLYLVCGVSRHNSSLFLKSVGLVLENLSSIFTSETKVPKDIRTVILQVDLEPTIIRTMVCSGCFSVYEPASAPQICLWRISPQSRPCNTPLFRIQQSGRGLPKQVPNRQYSTQELTSWLTWFLSRDGIEDALDQALNAVPQEIMGDVWHSPAWQSLGDFVKDSGNYVFGIFIDWYNPLTNKIAGKKMSLGLILLVCYSLPHEIRWLPANLFILGIIPGLKEPTVATINHVIKPAVDTLLTFEGGEYIQTKRSPAGRKIRIRLLPSITDAVGGQKLEGCASHTAKQFCPYCELPHDQLSSMHLSASERTTTTILRDANAFKALVTETDRAAHVKKTGRRWTELHRLSYRDHQMCNVLGIMHNWLIGVLQHHARRKWGLDIARAKNDDNLFKPQPATADDSVPMDIDTDDDLEQEVHGLLEDAASDLNTLEERRARVRRAGTVPPEEGDDLDEAYTAESESSQDSSDGESDAELQEARSLAAQEQQKKKKKKKEEEPIVNIFVPSDLEEIRSAIGEAYLPSWIDRPPVNFGEKSHGKLKADNWLVLFTILLVFSLPEMWLRQNNVVSQKLLANFYDLSGCTHILFNYTTSERAAKIFGNLYKSYHKTLAELFPRSRLRPNHHYALHLPMLMTFWGPLMRLSEFPGERMIGQLQQIKTNHRVYQFDLTALRQICRRSRLLAHLQSTLFAVSPLLQSIKALLSPSKASVIESQTNIPLSGTARAAFNRIGQYIPGEIYDGILNLVNKTRSRNKKIQHYANLPYPRSCSVLTRTGHEKLTCQRNGRTISLIERNANNGIVWLLHGKEKQPAKVVSIWEIEVDGHLRVFLEVAFFKILSDTDQAMNWCRRYPFFFVSLHYAQTTESVIVEDCDIICQGAARVRPAGTFGIKSETILVADLNRWRQM